MNATIESRKVFLLGHWHRDFESNKIGNVREEQIWERYFDVIFFFLSMIVDTGGKWNEILEHREQ